MGRDQGKRVREIVRIVQRTPGWTVTLTRRCHWKFTAPDGKKVFASLTPSRESEGGLRRDLRRIGFVFDDR